MLGTFAGVGAPSVSTSVTTSVTTQHREFLMRTTALASTAALILTLTLAACSGADEESMPQDPASEESMAEDESVSDEEMTEDPMGDEEMGDEEMTEDPMSDEEMTEEDMGQGDMSARSGTLDGMDEHLLAGTVEVSDTEIVLTGFSSDEATDLRLHLTSGTDEAALDQGMEIGAVASDQESQTLPLDGMTVSDYDTVVITGGMDGAVFGTAPLS